VVRKGTESYRTIFQENMQMTEQQQKNKILTGNAETLRALSNPMATGEESASSGTRPCGSNPLYDRVVLNPTER